MRPSEDPLLSVQDVKKYFDVRGSLQRKAEKIYAVDGVSFDVQNGETLGLVGESGCGKSTLARVVTGLQRQTAGVVRLAGFDVPESAAREPIRGKGRSIQSTSSPTVWPSRSSVEQRRKSGERVRSTCSSGWA
jgi:oligopeptide transport system ATP-binding protein